MKTLTLLLLMISSSLWANSPCDVQVGESFGVRVLKFTDGHKVHAKMLLSELSTGALTEEMTNLQDEGICSEKISAKKCVLKFEKKPKTTLNLYRDGQKWTSWEVASKREAQIFVKSLQRAGFCS